jgi:hypothetical protein
VRIAFLDCVFLISFRSHLPGRIHSTYTARNVALFILKRSWPFRARFGLRPFQWGDNARPEQCLNRHMFAITHTASLALVSLAWLPRPPPLLAQPPRAASRPLSIVVAQRAARSVLMCSEPVTVLVGGKPVEEGDGLLCRDADSDAWWRATVKDIDGSRVLVHYTGCSDDWDLWMDASSTDLMRAEDGGVQKSSFQSEEYEEGLDDEELLEAMRERKWAENARWQLNVFAQEQLGEWQGEWPCRNQGLCVAGHRGPGG